MQPMTMAYLPTEDQAVIPQLFGEIGVGDEEAFVFSPWSGKNEPPGDHPGDFLVLKPDLVHWEWLAVLLQCRRRNSPPEILLYSPRTEGPEDFLTLADDHRVLLFHDPEELKGYVRQVRAGREKKTILFVDDDLNVLKSYERSLRKSPWRILTTDRGEQAIQLISRERVDLVITDIKMPEMHGFALIAKIRKESNTVPIMVCSAYPGLRQDADLYFYNVSAFIEKPVNSKTLEARIKELVGRG